MMLLLHLYGADRAGIQVSRKHAKRDYGGGGGGEGGFFHHKKFAPETEGGGEGGGGGGGGGGTWRLFPPIYIYVYRHGSGTGGGWVCATGTASDCRTYRMLVLLFPSFR